MAEARSGEAALLSVTEAAALLGVSAKTLRKWSDEGIIIPARLPGRGDRRFTKDEVTRVRAQVLGLAEGDLMSIRERNRVERWDTAGGGACMLCRAFGHFPDGKPQISSSMVYHPPEAAVGRPSHVHRVHKLPSVPQIEADARLLEQELDRLAVLYPQHDSDIEPVRQRLAVAMQGPASAVMERLSDIARSTIHIRRVSGHGPDTLSADDPLIR
jgi:excisionase family DNA binding protein